MKRLALTICLAVAACTRAHEDPTAGAAAPAVSAITARVGQFVETVPATGRFGAASGSQVRLAFAEPGIVAAVHVRLGARVAQGDALADLDATKLALSAEQAAADARAAVATRQEAQVDRTTAKIRFDEDALRRARSLYAAGVAPRKDIESASEQLADDAAQAAAARAGVSSSAAEVASAQARVALAQRDLAQTTLRAPIGGVVVAVLHRVGESVDPSTPVVVISPAERGDLTLLVTSSDLGRVKEGDNVRYVLAGSGVRGVGTIIGVAAVLDPDSQSGNVAARVRGADVPEGTLVEAEIEVRAVAGIVLPQEAVVADPQTGKTFVFVEHRQQNGSLRFEQRAVRVGDRHADQVLIAAGVRPGDRVAAQGAFALLAPSDGG